MRPRYVELMRDATQDRAVLGRLPRRRRRRLLRLELSPLVGVRGAAAALPARRVRLGVVLAPGGRIAPSGALGRGPAADRGRAPARAHRVAARARGDRRTKQGAAASMRRVVIAGAAGRDFHNFNVAFRDADDVEVVAFTATQIPDIDGRVYPPELAGGRAIRTGSRSSPRTSSTSSSRDGVDEVVFAYSDVSHEHVMHIGSRVLAAGADYRLMGPRATELTLLEAGRRRSAPCARAPARARRRATSPGCCARRACASPSSGTRCRTATSSKPGRAAVRALRGSRRGRLHDRGAGGVRAAPRRGQPRLRRRRLRGHPRRRPRRRRT